MAQPRTIGPITKAAGTSVGIGLQNEDKEGKREDHIKVAYVEDDSIFIGQIGANDEVMEVNGVHIDSAKICSKTIVEATELTLKVCGNRTIFGGVILSVWSLSLAGLHAEPDDPDHDWKEPEEEIGAALQYMIILGMRFTAPSCGPFLNIVQ